MWHLVLPSYKAEKQEWGRAQMQIHSWARRRARKSTIRLVEINITAEQNPAPHMKSNVAATADTRFPTPTMGEYHPQIFLGQMNEVGVKMCVIWSHAFVIAPHLTSQLAFLMPCKQIVTLGSCLTSFPRPWSASSVFFPTMAPFIVKHLLLPLCPVTNKQMNVLLLIANNLQSPAGTMLFYTKSRNLLDILLMVSPCLKQAFPPAINWKCLINEKNRSCDWCCWGLFTVCVGLTYCLAQNCAHHSFWQSSGHGKICQLNSLSAFAAAHGRDCYITWAKS